MLPQTLTVSYNRSLNWIDDRSLLKDRHNPEGSSSGLLELHKTVSPRLVSPRMLSWRSTWVGHRDELPRPISIPASQRRHSDHHDRTNASDDAAVEDGGFFVGSPSKVAEGGLEEARG